MVEQKLSAGMKTGLEQHQHLSHNLQRSLELLALPLPELESRLLAELANNPLLEEITPEDPGELPVDPSEELNSSDGDYESDDEDAAELPDEWRDDLPLPGEKDAAPDIFSFMAAPAPELRSMLLLELSMMPLSDLQHRLATEIVTALNDDGYLTSTLADLAMRCDADMDEAKEALETVQNIAPAGVGARDIAECLLLQLARSGRLTPSLQRLLHDGLEDLEKNRLRALEKKLGVSAGELEEMLKILRSLNPAPGRAYSSANTAAVVADLEITCDDDGEYRSIPRDGGSTRLRIPEFYENLQNDDRLSADDRVYISEKMERARELLRALEMRGSTLKRLGDFLIRHQRDFLDNGVKFLRGMTMKDAAEELELSESTISRCVADKFVKTPQGMFPLRFFFSAGYRGDDGSDRSSQAILEEIRSIIASENPYAPFSDDEIARQLKKNGVDIARRTIAKYRDILKIPSSSRRKKYF